MSKHFGKPGQLKVLIQQCDRLMATASRMKAELRYGKVEHREVAVREAHVKAHTRRGYTSMRWLPVKS